MFSLHMDRIPGYEDRQDVVSDIVGVDEVELRYLPKQRAGPGEGGARISEYGKGPANVEDDVPTSSFAS